MMIFRANRLVAAVMLLLAGLLPLLAQEKSAEAPAKNEGKTRSGKAPSETPDTAQGGVAVQTSQGLGAFGKVLPLGEKNLDVKIPSFKDGAPSSTVRAASMTRVDDENMAMEKMDIRLYGSPGDADAKSRDVRVQLISANYHMPSQILTSDRRSRVTREDFDIQGDSMIFDTKTQQGKMVGNVHMVIFDSESLAPKPSGSKAADATSKSAEAAPAPNPQPTPPPANEKK